MRAKVRKRKIVPIEATIVTGDQEFRGNLKDEAEKARIELYKILGRRVFEFCGKEISHSNGDPGFFTVTARIRVVDSR